MDLKRRIGGDMLKALGSRLTYANVVATGALFLALGGGAYALTGIPDRGGVFHGCVSNTTGLLRVVKSASSCQKPTTVRRHGKRVRLPGELAVSWNQQGPRGLQGTLGIQGTQGQKGDTGAPGQNATKLFGYIIDGQLGAPATDTATLRYGSGVTAVGDPSGANAYTVTFDRSVENCVVQAIAGHGDPADSNTVNVAAIPNVQMNQGGHNQVQVGFESPSVTPVDTSFMITAFC
jgi:hypothetical protein